MPIATPLTKIEIETPSGNVTSFAKIDDGNSAEIYFENVHSFVQELYATIDLHGFGKIKYDLAFGGAFYAIINSKKVGLELKQEHLDKITQLGKEIKTAISKI